MSTSRTPGRGLAADIDYDALSPSQIFKPRNPGVRRSPPPGSTISAPQPPAGPIASSSSATPKTVINDTIADQSVAPAVASPRTARSSPRTGKTPVRAAASPQASPTRTHARAGSSTTPRGLPSSLQHAVPLDADTTVENSDMDIDPPSFAEPSRGSAEEPALLEDEGAVEPVQAKTTAVEDEQGIEPEEIPVRPLEVEVSLPEGNPMPPPAIVPVPAPEPKTPVSKPISKSKRTATEAFVEKAVPVEPTRGEETGEYGKRHNITMDTLLLAAKAASTKWKAKDLQSCLPLLAAQHKQTMEHVWLNSSQSMQAAIMDKATFLFDHYRVGPALQDIDAVVNEAKQYATAHPDASGRRDAWRPDLSPATLTVAANLPMYDEVYGRLRDEYLELHQQCSGRYRSIMEKQEELRMLEGAVSDGVVELEQTIKILEGFPTEEMMAWTEKVAGQMDGRRG